MAETGSPKRGSLGTGAESLRLAMWLLILLTVGLGCLTFLAIRKILPPDLAVPATLLGFGSALSAFWCGARGHRRAIADREAASDRAMVIAMAVALGRQGDATLERMAAEGGPAAEAATLILRGRRAPHRPDKLGASSARPSVER